MNELIYFGGAVKVLDENGRVGGIGIRFSERGIAARKDLSEEYFTDTTYLGPNDGDGQECIFHHGIPLKASLKELADHVFAPAKAKRDKVGIFVETVLDLSNEYEKAVFELAKKGKLGWSSASANHRVIKNADGEIVRWPVAEWSLTPQPCEPQNYGGVLPLKSIGDVKFITLDEGEDVDDKKPLMLQSLAAKLTQLIDDRVDDGQPRDAILKSLARAAALDSERVNAILDGSTPRPPDAHLKAIARVLNVDFAMLRETAHGISPQTIKGIFEEALADRTPSRWEIDSAFCDVVRKLANVASSTVLTGVEFDMAGKVSEAVAEYMTRLRGLVIAQIEEYVQSGSDEPFYLKAIIDLDSPSLVNLSLEDQSQLVVSALRDVVKRYRANHEARQRGDNNHKAGRVLSEKNRARVSAIMEQMSGLVSDCQKLLDESMPMASTSQKLAAITDTLRRQHAARKLGVPAN